MAVNTAIPDAASGSQRCSQTRRDASTTSKGAGLETHPRRIRRAGHALRFPRRASSPMTPSASSASISDRAEAELAEELAVVLPEERRVARVQPLGTTCEPASGACCSGSCRSPGCSTSSKKWRDWNGGRSGWSCGWVTAATGTPASHSRFDHLVGLLVAAPLRQAGVDLVLGAHTALPVVSSSGSAAQVGSPNAVPERAPLLVGGDRDGHPRVVPGVLIGLGDPVEVLRRGGRASVALAFEERPVRGVLDHLLRGDVDARRRPSPPRPSRPRPSRRCWSASEQAEDARAARRWGRRRCTARTGAGPGGRSAR